MRRTAWLIVGGCVTGAAALALIVTNFRANDPWLHLGLMGLVIAALVFAVAYFTAVRTSIKDAYDVGYEAGFRKGQRSRPKVIRLPSEPGPRPTSRR